MSISGISGLSPLVSAQSVGTDPTTTNPTSAQGDTASSAASSSASPTDTLLDPNQFLSLLVDSLKYQDPLDPTSSADFLQQLASLSQVQTESQVAQTEQTSAAANLIGKTVTGDDPSGTSITGVVTGFSMTSNGPDLNIGNDSVSLGTISAVNTTVAAAAAGATDPTGTSDPTTPTSGGTSPTGGASGSTS
jgi:flagellar basal-body rod modification protein FlgD